MANGNKKITTSSFVQSMLQSAQEKKEVKPKSRCENVDQNQVEQFMQNLQKGNFRKKV